MPKINNQNKEFYGALIDMLNRIQQFGSSEVIDYANKIRMNLLELIDEYAQKD